jgi:hypothetical protein
MDIIGVDHNDMSFFIAFAFLPDQLEGLYRWTLAQIRTIFKLIHPTIGLIPGSISTDCDQTLRNAISTIFPESGELLCLWYANKNIQQHCKGKFTSAEAYQDFFNAWLGIVRSPDIPKYQAQLHQFLTKYSDIPEHLEAAKYIQTTWLKPGRAEALVQAWTNKYPHFGTMFTSRLVILGPFIARLMTYSVESAHALLKRYITSSQGDLLTTWLQIEQAVASQIQNIKDNAAKGRIRTPLHLNRDQYQACFGYITNIALRLVHSNYREERWEGEEVDGFLSGGDWDCKGGG